MRAHEAILNELPMFSCSQALEVMLGHVMEECDTCEARAAHVCSICFSSDPIFVFQVWCVDKDEKRTAQFMQRLPP